MDLAITGTGISYKPKSEKTEETYRSLNSINILGCDLAVDMSQ